MNGVGVLLFPLFLTLFLVVLFPSSLNTFELEQPNGEESQQIEFEKRRQQLLKGGTGDGPAENVVAHIPQKQIDAVPSNAVVPSFVEGQRSDNEKSSGKKVARKRQRKNNRRGPLPFNPDLVPIEGQQKSGNLKAAKFEEKKQLKGKRTKRRRNNRNDEEEEEGENQQANRPN